MPGPAFICEMRSGDIEFHRIETNCAALGNAGPGVCLLNKAAGFRPNVRVSNLMGLALGD